MFTFDVACFRRNEQPSALMTQANCPCGLHYGDSLGHMAELEEQPDLCQARVGRPRIKNGHGMPLHRHTMTIHVAGTDDPFHPPNPWYLIYRLIVGAAMNDSSSFFQITRTTGVTDSSAQTPAWFQAAWEWPRPLREP